jgi:UbiD family decarboxylase
MNTVDAQFPDLRSWLKTLEQQRQLARVSNPVHWREELGGVVRRAYDVYGDATPAMLFENIVDYQRPGPNKLFVGQFRSYSRMAMSMGLPPTGTTVRDIVDRVRTALRKPLPYQTTEAGTAQDNVLMGDDTATVDGTWAPCTSLSPRTMTRIG